MYGALGQYLCAGIGVVCSVILTVELYILTRAGAPLPPVLVWAIGGLAAIALLSGGASLVLGLKHRRPIR